MEVAARSPESRYFPHETKGVSTRPGQPRSHAASQASVSDESKLPKSAHLVSAELVWERGCEWAGSEKHCNVRVRIHYIHRTSRKLAGWLAFPRLGQMRGRGIEAEAIPFEEQRGGIRAGMKGVRCGGGCEVREGGEEERKQPRAGSLVAAARCSGG